MTSKENKSMSENSDQTTKNQNVQSWEELEHKLRKEEKKDKRKKSLKIFLKKFIDTWLEFPKTAVKQYATKLFRHLFFGLVPTIADICTDMALVNDYLNGNYYSVTKQNNGKIKKKT